MATTTIKIIDEETGAGIESVKIDLEFPHGGFAPTEWTDYSGEAVLTHESTGRAYLYIDGNYFCDINTPGFKTVRNKRS